MTLHNFINERRPVDVAGRRFVVRRPTLATVELVLALYAEEVDLLLNTPDIEQHAAVDLLLPLFTLKVDPRAARVLSSCVESAEPLEQWPSQMLAQFVLAMTNAPRIVKSLGLRKVTADSKPIVPAQQHAAIMRLAVRFGVTPFEVMQWPYEAYLDIVEALPFMDGNETAQPESHHPDFMAAMRSSAKPVEKSGN